MSGGSVVGTLEREYMDQEEPIFHPSNAVFWEWVDLPLTLSLTPVSRPACLHER